LRRLSFTMIELLVVIAIISILLAILIPGTMSARERARVVKACTELRQIAIALEGYTFENSGKVPPGRTYCESEKQNHWCDLPSELVASRWLPAGRRGSFLSSTIEDEFNRGHTYKYMSPGWGFHNNGVVPKSIWVPDDFPKDNPLSPAYKLKGKTYDNVTVPVNSDGQVIPCPVAWVVWSLGPHYDENQGSPELAPVARRAWYRGWGTRGVIPIIRMKEGEQIAWP